MEESSMIEKYWNEKVLIKKQHSKQMKGIVLPIVNNILRTINETDSRFGTPEITLHAGSAFQKLKVKRLDEFDFTVPVVTLQDLHWLNSEAKEGAWTTLSGSDVFPARAEDVTLKLVGSDDILRHEDMMLGQCVDPSKTRNIFHQLVMKAISILRLKEYVVVSDSDESPTTLAIHLPGYNRHPVSVDLMIMCPARATFLPKMTWPRPDKKWPSRSKIEEIKKKGICIVAKRDKFWTLSFVECEKVLMSDIDDEHSIRRKSHRIMKAFLLDIWSLEEKDKTLTSYHLKNVLFWECEKYPSPLDWKQDLLVRRLQSMIKVLRECLIVGKLPLYFYPAVNLFRNRSEGKRQLVASRVENTFNTLYSKYYVAAPTLQSSLPFQGYPGSQNKNVRKIVGSGGIDSRWMPYRHGRTK